MSRITRHTLLDRLPGSHISEALNPTDLTNDSAKDRPTSDDGVGPAPPDEGCKEAADVEVLVAVALNSRN